MGTHIGMRDMKTTIDIADDLINRARQIQKREDITLRALVEEGLRYAIKKHASGVKKYKFRPIVVGEPYVPGAPVVDVTKIIRDTYEERDNKLFGGRISEPVKRYSQNTKSRKKSK
jgi:hypothetical protein